MLRFILKRETNNENIGYCGTGYDTILLDVPELETLLTRGGCGEGGFDETTLIGVEVVKDA